MSFVFCKRVVVFSDCEFIFIISQSKGGGISFKVCVSWVRQYVLNGCVYVGVIMMSSFLGFNGIFIFIIFSLFVSDYNFNSVIDVFLLFWYLVDIGFILIEILG